MRPQAPAALLLLLAVASDAYAFSSGFVSSTAVQRTSCGASTRVQAKRIASPLLLRASQMGSADDEGVTRRGAMAKGLLGLAVFGIAGDAEAAVPTMDEYNVGSGTKIRVEKEEYKVKEEVQVTDKASLIKALDEVEVTLKEISGYCEKAAWDNVRALMQSSAVTQKYVKPDRPGVIFKAYGGLETEKAWVSATGAGAAEAKAFEKSRKAANQSLLQLSDFAFSNRVLFFNEEDKANVKRLESNLDVDLDEAIGLVDVALSSVKGMRKKL
uniref:Uncharacterized protein n=2 Tax=Hemiselmis andersenii TaxID=464988 RepID=A0A7S0Y0R5_HEMAN